MKHFIHIALFVLLLGLGGCNSSNSITPDRPTITIDDEDYIFSLKVGESVSITPEITPAEGVSIAWLLDGKKVSTAPVFEFTATQAGSFFLTLIASNAGGESRAEMRIDCRELLLPKIAFATSDGTLRLKQGTEHQIIADIINGENATLEWRLEGKVISTEPLLRFTPTTLGNHTLTLHATNEDGSASRSVELEVVDFIGKSYICPERTVALGRTLQLAPTLMGFEQPTFRWSVEGIEGVVCEEEIFHFTPDAEGFHTLQLEVSEQGQSQHHEILVHCCPPEEQTLREASQSSLAEWQQVYEYSPAPGQFINESQSGFEGVTSPDAAIAYAERRLISRRYLSLGGWGGCVVVGFDHSIPKREEGEELIISGNMYDSSSEAGIVWVMQDNNANSLPDDEWYELRGSEWGKPTHRQRYAIEYIHPAEGHNALWRTATEQGIIPRNASHTQATYYPAWIKQDMTLYGSLLAPNSLPLEQGQYYNAAYGWGYADNLGSDAGTEANGEEVICRFSISNAVNADGTPANLQYIDFVKVQSAINYTVGAMGEISTEVMDIRENTK